MDQFVESASYLAEAPVALIVGCGDMGMGCARTLGRRHPLLLIDIDAERLEQCRALLEHEGYSIAAKQCDIASAESVAGLERMLAEGPGIKVLAHVAAVGNTPLGWRHVLDVDLVGAHLVARAVGPHMVRGGVAILISSTGSYQCPRDDTIDALLDDPFQPDFQDRLATAFGREPDFLHAYFMAKHGVNRLAARLAIEWGPREVRALSLSPGLINSTMGRVGGKTLPIYDGPVSDRVGSRSEKAVTEVPLRRQGTLLEITAVVDFLASDAASFVNGIDVPVDGGSTARWRSLGITGR